MMPSSRCDCLVCKTEEALVAEFVRVQDQEEFRSFAAVSASVSTFRTAFELVRWLHLEHGQERNVSPDQVLADLIAESVDGSRWMFVQRLLLLIFVPTVHRTTSYIVSSFPALARDDTGQHVLAVLLEFLPSQELRMRRSHIAFTVARKLRRNSFRWAIRESRRYLQVDRPSEPITLGSGQITQAGFDSAVLLDQFLDGCERRGRLTREERKLLTRFKLEGMSGEELARQNGHSAVAIRHRIQRLVERLRRIAHESNQVEQLELFIS
jgi:hypothetical protein